MKKNLILLVSLITIIVLLVIWLKDEPSLTQVQHPEKSMGTTEPVLTTQNQTFVDQTSETDSLPVEQEVAVEATEQVPSNVCKEQLAEQYPDLQKQFDEVISGFYLSGEQMAGEGVYQNMPFESLKPLADGNNPEAMMVYGSDKIWHSATGIRVSRSESQYRTREQTKSIIKNHKINIDGVMQGEEYLYKAAVLGKVGSIFELAILLDFVARNLDKESADEEVIFRFLSTSVAFKKLILDIHQNDPAFKWMFSQSADPFNNIQRLYADREDYAEIRNRIESDAENLYQQLKLRWEHDREYYGFELYPDYLKGDLEEYGNAYLECHL